MQNKNRQPDTFKTQSPKHDTIKILFWYLVISFGYVIISDWALYGLVKNDEVVTIIQSVKGYLTLSLTGLFFSYFIFKREKECLTLNENLIETKAMLKLKTKKLEVLESTHYQLAFFDPLTGLYNTHKLKEEVTLLIDAKRPFYMLYIDIDDFGIINELKGFAWGDNALFEIAQEIKRVSQTDLVARMSEDGFVVILEGNDHQETIKNFTQRILLAVKVLLKKHSEAYFYSASGGISSFPRQADNFHTLLRHAHLALSEAKKRGKDQVVFYTQEMKAIKEKEVALTNEIIQSLKNEHFYVVYQPIYQFNSLECEMFEALIRWHHPEKGHIPPNEFIYLAEISGAIVEITDFVIKTVFKQLRAWLDVGYQKYVSINISPKVLMHPEFISKLNYLTELHQIDHSRIVLEVTETVLIDKLDQSLLVLKELKSFGYIIALDDFGTGYSSITYLKHLPIDIIKIDRSYIANIANNKREEYFLQFILQLSHGLQTRLVLEGVESKEQAQIIKKYPIDYVQGYLYGKPVSAEEAIQHVLKVTK